MKTLLAATLMLTVGLVAWADDKDKEPTGDLKAVQGSWTAMVGPEKNITLKLTVKGDDLDYEITTAEGQEIQFSAKLKLNEKAKPKELDITGLSVNGMDLPDSHSIYELNGDDWKTCGGGPGMPRPTEFKEDAEKMIRVTTFKRVKEEKKDEKKEEKKEEKK